MTTEHSERYIVDLYDDFDEPRHQDIQTIWTDDKSKAHAMAVRFVIGEPLKSGDVLDTKTHHRVHYGWFNRELSKIES